MDSRILFSRQTNSPIAVIIPAHNEALLIGETLGLVTNYVHRKDIYVVDDASTDTTSSIAKKYTPNVLILPTNRGKATAVTTALHHFSLAHRYSYILPLDADTHIQAKFIPNTLRMFASHPDAIAVVGKIQSRHGSWVSAYRAWEYELTQSLHKYAQSLLGGDSRLFRLRNGLQEFALFDY